MRTKQIRLLILVMLSLVASPTRADEMSWSNWEKRLDRAFEGINPRNIPGRVMGVIVPNETRIDLIPLTAFGYNALSSDRIQSLIILMPAPAQFSGDVMMMPSVDYLETTIGDFTIDTFLGEQLRAVTPFATVNNEIFTPNLPAQLELHLACLKYILKGKASKVKVLPVFVRLSDVNNQAKDLGSTFADKLKDMGLENDVTLVTIGNLSQTRSEEQLILMDSSWLNAIRTLDIDGILAVGDMTASSETLRTPDMSTLAFGCMLMKWLNADHTEILSYAHSSQLIMTKDKQNLTSYLTAAFASGPPYPAKIPHVDREKLLDIFNELFRSDLIALARQTCASILDPTAAKPPSMINPQAEKKWPVYVTLYDPEGKLAGQAGSYVAVGPLEESVRQFAFDAVQRAKPKLSKENFSKYVVDVSIPHGFSKVSKPEDLIPQLNGIIMEHEHKRDAFHPDGWRTYPDPHQLLSAICTKLGLRPWDYGTNKSTIESFRVLAFNEKEPFQDLGVGNRKKKKKKGAEEENAEEGAVDFGGGGGGGGFPF